MMMSGRGQDYQEIPSNETNGERSNNSTRTHILLQYFINFILAILVGVLLFLVVQNAHILTKQPQDMHVRIFKKQDFIPRSQKYKNRGFKKIFKIKLS